MLAPLSPVLFGFLVTWDVTFCGITRGPRCTAHYVRSKVERSCACAPLTTKPVWDLGFFAHALFLPKKQKVMGFSGSVNRTTKTPGFLDFGFCQCKWALSVHFEFSNFILVSELPPWHVYAAINTPLTSYKYSHKSDSTSHSLSLSYKLQGLYSHWQSTHNICANHIKSCKMMLYLDFVFSTDCKDRSITNQCVTQSCRSLQHVRWLKVKKIWSNHLLFAYFCASLYESKCR